MSDYKLNKNERIDVEEILKDLEHYHPRRRGWTWRTPAPAEQLKQGPFQYRDISANMEGDSVGLMTAHYFDNIDPQPMPTITTEIASGRFEDDIRRMRMAAHHGADHIMVIRTAGQSHFDGLIEGTPQGIGGVPITRKQVRAQRKALDMIEDEVGRPINYHSYVSGVAGPDVAVMFAEEGVNGWHQDPQYNVLYRNINCVRSFVDACESKRIMAWADKYRTLKVRTNADTPADAKKARELGAEGIGLCRTEHMFFEADRIAAFREMICSDTAEEREVALAKILPYQQGDFEKLYTALEGNPVTIRFLDPPLHEFVPTEEADIEALAKAQGKSVADIKAIIASLHEFNPMMGHRGCRLAVTYPEIAKMQTAAVIRAAINVQKAHADWNVKPEIMIPLVGDVKELKFVKKVVVETADAEIAAAGVELAYEVGTMIEIPRACLTADEIAANADFFCFGTNDLTQMTYGFSRDDAGKFLEAYYETKIFENDPFAKLDQVGVGKLMNMAISLGRPVNPNLHVGICGEHGGDPTSVEFCHKIGLDYVSCSPFRVPIARLAAAQAAISNK